MESTLVADLLALVRAPRGLLAERLRAPLSPRLLLVGTVLPLALVRPAAVLVRSIVTGHPVAGVVLGTGSVALQLGCWVALALALPPLAKQFGATIDERQGLLLATYASIPLWLAGVLYLVPEEPWSLFVWSRFLVSLAALYGLYLLTLGLEALAVNSRRFIVGAATATYLMVYFVLFVLLGLGSHVALFVLGA